MLKKEILANRTAIHENIGKFYEVQETEKSIYLVFELILGQTLEKWSSKKDKNTIADIRTIMLTLLQVIQHLQSKNLIHRDLKPGNIMISKSLDSQFPTVKVIDLGLVTCQYDHKAVICGTPGYIAPEILTNPEPLIHNYLNSKVDIFSAGVIFHELLFRSSVFKGNSAKEVYVNNLKGKLQVCSIEEMLIHEGGNCPIAYDLMYRMLCPNPRLRISVDQALQHPFFNCKILGQVKSGNEGVSFEEGVID